MVCREQRGCEVMESLVLGLQAAGYTGSPVWGFPGSPVWGFPVASYTASPVLGMQKQPFRVARVISLPFFLLWDKKSNINCLFFLFWLPFGNHTCFKSNLFG